MDASGLRRKDTTKGPPLRILSLDGGGVRGYSIFIIVQEIMHRTFVEMEGRAPRRNEIPKPADHFDLIVGTGTGGLIALMLGRLRLDIETCKELYVRLTRVVFETDKTVFGIPTRSTLFKASKLEEAIREAVREHTLDEDEGNDGTPINTAPRPMSPHSVASRSSAAYNTSPRRHSSNASVVSFSARSPTAQFARPAFSSRGGDPHAKLYDYRENRTKTAVTAMYKGTQKGTSAAMLRSYDSRKETAPEFDCRIWEAGRATCAIGLAFKPIQIGQSVFHDDGAGTFNPSPQVLDEAVVNEWPGREVGVFISVGTGRRPNTSGANQTMWYEGFLGEFAEARKRLIAKIEGCEKIHEYMKKEHLLKRGVNVENYYRLNVEVGVGEFGMNEWHRLAEISTSTRTYLAKEEKAVQSAAAKLAKINRANMRFDRLGDLPSVVQTMPDIAMPLAVELPGDIPTFSAHHTPSSRQSYESGPDSLHRPGLAAGTPSPRSSGDRPRTGYSNGAPPSSLPPRSNPQGHGEPPQDDDFLVVNAPTPSQWRTASGHDKIAITATDERPLRRPSEPASPSWPLGPSTQPHRIEPPPLPPKTPLPEQQNLGPPRPPPTGPLPPLPYPLDDDRPPPVDMAKKPAYRGR